MVQLYSYKKAMSIPLYHSVQGIALLPNSTEHSTPFHTDTKHHVIARRYDETISGKFVTKRIEKLPICTIKKHSPVPY